MLISGSILATSAAWISAHSARNRNGGNKERERQSVASAEADFWLASDDRPSGIRLALQLVDRHHL